MAVFNFPGSRFLKDADEQDRLAYEQGGRGAQIGSALRNVTTFPLAVMDDVSAPVRDIVRPAFDAAAQGLKTFVTGDASPINAQPPRTANAVNTTAGMTDYPDYPTAQRVGYEEGRKASTTDTTMSVPVPASTRARMGQPARSSLPEFSFNAQQPGYRQELAEYNNRVDGEGLGMLSPRMEAQLYDLESEARPLLSSAGIVDRLRGRQLMRTRSRLVDEAGMRGKLRIDATNAATGRMGANISDRAQRTNEFRASNEVPLALLNATTQREINDANVAERRYATQAGLMTRMDDVIRGEMMTAARNRGDTSEMERAALFGKTQPTDRNPVVQPTNDGRFLAVYPDGRREMIDPSKIVDSEVQRRRAALVDQVK